MSAEQLFDVRSLVCIVTGGASGIGLACGEAMAENGATVILGDVDSQRLALVVDRLRARGFSVEGKRLDVSSRVSVAAAFDDVHTTHGRLDVVFANAGVDVGEGFIARDGSRSVEGALENITDQHWRKYLGINLDGVLHTLQEAARHMKPQGSGKIVVTTSVASFCNIGGVGTSYFAAKAAASHLMRQAALELARYNIQVNAMAPGAFATNIANGHVRDPETRQLLESSNPQHRVADPEEIKGLALLLASGASSFITGSEIVIDGGSLLGLAD
ncbi:SDR family NAD(P)-dependent oxidoreductase [Pseudomonas citronellolis]|uniref:SDR family NAD(P)-dependent oxidoreductase n=1 Tax=Pseudomonas citronellolis TaxID=53408 RepID=UPI00078B5334|nr:SDR family oxidoreductase [Pseudomonas citronellolis]AMO76074.1 Gluconate 5-dehydrogenase [Pseudomonas citronellolis]